MDLLMEKKNLLNIKEEEERIKRDENAKREFNEQSDNFKRNIAALGSVLTMISMVGPYVGQ